MLKFHLMKLKTKLCNKCSEEKPLEEFYSRRNVGDGYMNWCKDCHKSVTYGNTIHPKDKAVEIGAASLIRKLLSLGVYAAPGKASVFKHVDVVAWGCVRIEVKSSNLRPNKSGNPYYSFGLTPQQQETGLQADIIVLICLDGSTYHVFPADYPIFFNNDRLRKSIVYTPSKGREYQSEVRKSLSRELMSQFKDAWYFVERKRLEISEKLRQGFEP